jgi:hypothetical protein
MTTTIVSVKAKGVILLEKDVKEEIFLNMLMQPHPNLVHYSMKELQPLTKINS